MKVRQVFASLKHRKGLAIRRLLVFVTCLLVVYLVTASSTTAGSIASSSNDRPSDSAGRNARETSPFHWVESRRIKAVKKATRKNGLIANFGRLLSLNWSKYEDRELQLLTTWDKAPVDEKCRYLIDAIYAINKDWTNGMIVDFYNHEETDNLLASLMGERLRLFDYCFISGKLSLRKVFEISSFIDPFNKSGSSAEDYVKRVFPFLNQAPGSMLWPNVTNLNNGRIEPIPRLPQDFNEDFWLNWQAVAKGKGIVVTLNEASKHLFFKQLKVLEHNENRLPIQIITAGNEFSDDFMKELKEAIELSDQQVYLVDCSPILDTTFAKKNIVNVINKWLAVIFNTFEEALLLDVDAVPFVPMERFFLDKSYKQSGIMMYKDRFMPNEHTFQYCVDMLRGVEPSLQEKNLIKSRLKFYFGLADLEKSEEAAVYQRFFQDLHLHHVDSGLVVINKVRNLNGLIFSFMLNLDAKMKRCVYGDKEMFWLGQLYAGQDYTIYPTDGAIIGPVRKYDEIDGERYQICATQIAHCDDSKNLLWTNGGLKTCKLSNGAEADFQKDPDYFEQRYGDLSTLQHIYDAPLQVEGLIIPNREERWMQLKECSNYIYCATVKEHQSTSNTQQSIPGQILLFDESTLKKHNSIVSIWNQL